MHKMNGMPMILRLSSGSGQHSRLNQLGVKIAFFHPFCADLLRNKALGCLPGNSVNFDKVKFIGFLFQKGIGYSKTPAIARRTSRIHAQERRLSV